MASPVNGPAGMYKIQAFFPNTATQMDLPECMYKMPSFHAPFESQSEGASQEDQTLLQLEQRQEAILAKLNVLKSQVDVLGKKTKINTTTGTTTDEPVRAQASTSQTQGKKLLAGLSVIEDLVISASPASPPLSLLVLYHLLAEQYKTIAACHTHSSVTGGVSEKLKQALGNDGLIQGRTGAQLAITLIWKDVRHGPSLMVSPNIQTAIQGEGSIARYLARLLHPAYDSSDITNTTEIDQLVDLAAQLITGNNKEKAGILRTLNTRLGKGSYLVKQLSLADMVLWSAVHQTKQAEAAPPNVKRWLEKCAQHPAFTQAISML